MAFKRYFPLIPIFLFTILFSCKKDTLDPVDVGYSYYPVSTGHWIWYEVDSTVWDDFYPVDSPLHVRNYHYDIKEVIESEYYDNEGRLTQRLERYQKLCDTCEWFIKDVWAVNLTPSTVEKVEENYRFVKMIFPIENNTSWDGNAFNILDEQDYEYDDIFDAYTINGHSFDSTVTVIEKIDSNAIEASKQYEVYAKNVGMVFRRYRDVRINNLTHEIISGQDYTFKLISYGD